MFRHLIVLSVVFLPFATALAAPPVDVAAEIQLEAAGVELTLMAEHPDVVTPTGIDVDPSGNLWVVASHTHFRPEDYDGPEHDEILVLDSSGARRVFYNKTDATMDLELGPEGWVYLAERDRILRVRDSNGDGIGDEEQDLAVLQSEADYPHNGLSGMAWHPSGDLLFALGENYWKEWTLTAPDGSAVKGTGEGGVFRCKPNGSSLRRIAKGFWNPFGLCARDDGTIFAAENDPGARPPCRLLHVVEGGDYGYQRLYGNSPVHPFVCWNGELRGTLPMLHSVGEAPCGIVPLGNGLIVPTWADHRIDFYPLRDHGASFQTERVVLVRGSKSFRPTCITQASPTTFYLTDWVHGSYELHGYGRVWKLQIDPDKAPWLTSMKVAAATEQASTAARLREGGEGFSDQQLFTLAKSDDPFIARAAIDAIAQRFDAFSPETVQKLSVEDRLCLLLAARVAQPKSETWARHFWSEPDDEIAFETLRWIADERLDAFREDVERKINDPQLDYRLFEACLATWNTLSGDPRAGVTDEPMLLDRVRDEQTPNRTRAFALRLLDPTHDHVKGKLFYQLIESGDEGVIREVARALAATGSADGKIHLRQLAGDRSYSESIRADAIAGLTGATGKLLGELLDFAASESRAVREEALRAIRFCELDQTQRQRLAKIGDSYPQSQDLVDAAIDPTSVKLGRPDAGDTPAWESRLAAIAQPVDRQAGRRIFHHATVGICSKCHRHSGRGNVVGPDLSAASTIGQSDRLLTALLQPSRIVDPQFYPWSLITDDGRAFTGIMLRKGGSGKEFYRDSAGREQMFLRSEIVMRKELTSSMMPDGLIDTMTDREIRDVLAFLDSSAEPSDGDEFVGQWWLEFADGYGGWLSVERRDSELQADLLWRVGSARPVKQVELKNGALHLHFRRAKKDSLHVATIDGDRITVATVTEFGENTPSDMATGKRCPPMPPRPDLDSVEFGERIVLFNGRDLSGWKLHPPDANNGWSAKDGVLINETPKTDFSAYGAFGNLRTERTFEDFKLHIEFKIDEKRNSGVYLRGLYEAQVVDRDSPMQGINGPGAIFGRIAPAKNAGLPGGQWQTYDLILVDRHVTVVLNGEVVIDNQPVVGCTGGALKGDVTSPGPIYLQGDHTSVQYRNIILSPRVKTK